MSANAAESGFITDDFINSSVPIPHTAKVRAPCLTVIRFRWCIADPNRFYMLLLLYYICTVYASAVYKIQANIFDRRLVGAKKGTCGYHRFPLIFDFYIKLK